MSKVKDFLGSKIARKGSKILLNQVIKRLGKEVQRIHIDSIEGFKGHATRTMRKKIQCSKCGYPKKHEDVVEIHGDLVMYEKTKPNFLWVGEAVCRECEQKEREV